MISKINRASLILLIVIGVLSLGNMRASAMSPALQMGSVYEQPVDPNGKLILSSWRDPDGSDYDELIWDDFMLAKDGTITAIKWYGGYDPLKFGKGGPVTDFTVSIYPSTALGREPAVANPPLVQYHTAGNAGETAFDVFNGTQINVYSFNLPSPFVAAAGVKYWVYIIASQSGSLPDWCFIAGTGGDGNHYTRTSGAGGDVLYRFMPGDVAVTLLGSSADAITPTPITAVTATPSDTPAPTSIPATSTSVSEPTATPINAPTPIPAPQPPTCLGSLVLFMMLFLFVKSASR